MSPVGIGEPDCMNAPRKRPSGSPPFVSNCSATEIAPALSPHLPRPYVSAEPRSSEEGPSGRATHIVTLVGSPPNAEMYFWTQRSARRSVNEEGRRVHPSAGGTAEDIEGGEWLTVLQAEIPNAGIANFLAREETEGCMREQ